jgi:branched-subunit amino acid transport protein AzlD
MKTSSKTTGDLSIKGVESCAVFGVNKIPAFHERRSNVMPSALIAVWIVVCFAGIGLWKKVTILRGEIGASRLHAIPIYLKNRVLLI